MKNMKQLPKSQWIFFSNMQKVTIQNSDLVYTWLKINFTGQNVSKQQND